MFDPPYRHISVVGTPILKIPDAEKKYKCFLDWWVEVGRLKPEDPQGWSTLSGPGVMRDRVEAIPPAEWSALPSSERDLIRAWADCLPVDLLYD
jgi:hypothetical protein